MLFNQAIRGSMREANPEASITDIAKLMGAEWQCMSTEAKQEYVDKAAVLKAEYNAAVELEGGGAGAGSKRPRSSGAPAVSTKKRKTESSLSASAAVEVIKVHSNGFKEYSDGSILDENGNPRFASEVDAKPRVQVEPDLAKFEVQLHDEVMIVLPALEEFLASAKGVAKEGTLAHVDESVVAQFPALATSGVLQAKCTKVEDADDAAWKIITL